MNESLPTPEPVVFRVFPDGDVIALFPAAPGTPDPSTCASYMHVGQHGAADYACVVADTRPATVKELAPLRAELKQIGYRLQIVARKTAAHDRRRLVALARAGA